MTESKTYRGGCHCGKVRYDVTTALAPMIACNCSICAKRAPLLTFVPESAFTLLAGENDLTDYRFNTKKLAHLFCKECGIESFARGAGPDGKPMVAVNARCLEGVDVDALEVTRFDGRSR